MKIKPVTHHGLKRWRVDLSEGEAGKRVRKFFASRTETEKFARKATETARQHGRRFARYWATLSPLAQGAP